MSLKTFQHPANKRGSWPNRLVFHKGKLLALLPFFLLLFVHSAALSAATTITPESLSVQRAEIERAANLPDDQKNAALAKIDESRALLDEAQRFASRTQAMLNRIREAPEQLKKLRQSMAVAELKLDPAALDLWTNEQLEVVLNERQLRLVEMQDSFADADRVLGTYLALARTGGGELGELEKRLAGLQSASVTNGVAEPLQTVESAWQLARQRELESRIDWSRTQQSNLTLLTDLAQRDRDLASAQVEAMKTHVAQLRDYVQKRRQATADTARRVALEAVSNAPDAISAKQREISRMAVEQAELVTKETEFESENERLVRLAEDIKRAHERMMQAVELGGPTAEVSNLLQKRRAFAPPPKNLARRALEYQALLSNASLRQLELDELLRDTRDSEGQIDKMLGTGQIDESQREAMRQAAREVQSAYREALLSLWKTYTRYISKLSILDASTLKLRQASEAYRGFIDDRLLWLPSTDLIPIHEGRLLFDGLRWFGLPENLSHLLADVQLAITRQGLLFAIWLTGLLTLLALRRRALNELRTAAATTQKVRTDSFMATFKSLGATLILILPLPWAFVGAGVLLGRLPGVHEYSAIIAVGLQGVGHTLLLLRTLRQLCRPQGLARVHLAWHPVLCDHLGRQAAWLTPLAAPLAFFSTAGTASVPSAFIHISGTLQTEEPGVLALGRLSMIVLMLLLGIAIYRIWRKNGPVIQAMAASTDRAKWASYHILWFVPSMAVPFFLALAASVGFYYTSAFLGAKAGETIWFVLVLVLTKDLVQRGLRVAQRRLRFEEAVRHREEALAHRNEPAGTGAEPPASELPLEEDKIDYGGLGSQVRQLVRLSFTILLLIGLWLIWRDVIPALNFLNEVSLPISTTKLVDGVSTEVPLTLADMVAGLMLGGLALFAARNVPALLELTLLQRLPLSRASRYAITTLTQYIVAMAGLIISFNALGLQWSSIQWLVAALSVGLGFGLQEIVANFISGIILLFEQPIRVGDVVTVENTTGTVSRIRIRATTIVNWERQELIIPNKSFITGQLINWSLSDTVNRLFITVGVDYDTDTRKAMQLMAEVAAEHPKVLNDPPPRITFEGFGDNALTLNMRAYLDDLDARIQTITELHQAILDKFRAAGIVIAFPQRDLHLDSSRPLELVLRKEALRDTRGT
jgi:potassium efflux system protein